MDGEGRSDQVERGELCEGIMGGEGRLPRGEGEGRARAPEAWAEEPRHGSQERLLPARTHVGMSTVTKAVRLN